MNNKHSHNYFLKSLLQTFTVFAVIHVIFLSVLVIFTGNLEFLNVFYIVGLHYFIPGIDKGMLSQAISALIIIAVFFFFFNKNKK